ncbi:MAG: response regulator transcription factor [Spirochaetota bacterium]
MNARVLVVEDVIELANLVSLYLSREGLEVHSVESAEEATTLLPDFDPDLILLDINLPGMDGFEFLGTIHGKTRARVIIVSARDADEDIITGLGYGADEFITKPFSPRVLVARIRAVLRREKEYNTTSTVPDESVSFGSFSLDLRACMLFRGKERIHLSAREFDVLNYLVRNEGVPKNPQDIYTAVWKNLYGDLTAVAVYIQRLRKKIEEDASAPRWIETVHGIGYRFNQGEGSST